MDLKLHSSRHFWYNWAVIVGIHASTQTKDCNYRRQEKDEKAPSCKTLFCKIKKEKYFFSTQVVFYIWISLSIEIRGDEHFLDHILEFSFICHLLIMINSLVIHILFQLWCQHKLLKQKLFNIENLFIL